MQTTFSYRAYEISFDGREYVAKDGDSGAELGAKSVEELIKFIDQVWDQLESPTALKRWMRLHTQTYQRIHPSKHWTRAKIAKAVTVGAVATFALFVSPKVFDIDGDGQLTSDDVHHAVNFLMHGSTTVRRIVMLNGKPTAVVLAPTPDPAVDWSMTTTAAAETLPSK